MRMRRSRQRIGRNETVMKLIFSSTLERLSPRSAVLFAVVTGAIAAGACAPPRQAPLPHILTEAYSHLDQGNNAKAILLLEKAVLEDPSENSEARFLLASAYLGQAGVNVYALYDSFQDVLFSQSLEKTLLKGKKPKSELTEETPVESADPEPTPSPSVSVGPAPVQSAVVRMDRLLNSLRRAFSFLNRFPDVKKRDWSLIERAIDLLDTIPPEKDVRLYRVFARTVYIKAYLSRHIVRDREIGTSAWACDLELPALSEGIDWISGHLAFSIEDLTQVFPGRTSSLVPVQSWLTVAREQLTLMAEESPDLGSRTALAIAQKRIRERLECEN